MVEMLKITLLDFQEMDPAVGMPRRLAVVVMPGNSSMTIKMVVMFY